MLTAIVLKLAANTMCNVVMQVFLFAVVPAADVPRVACVPNAVLVAVVHVAAYWRSAY